MIVQYRYKSYNGFPSFDPIKLFPEILLSTYHLYILNTQCMVYLPACTIKIHQI